MHAMHLVVRQMDAMSEHGTRPTQLVMVVDVEISFTLRKQLPYPRDLGFILRHVRLHVAVWVLAP
jgi:hypothetical protein